MEKTPDQVWGDHFDGGGGGTGTGQGFGSGHGRLGRSHRARAPRVRYGSSSVSESTALSVGNLADIAPAEGVEAGALFSYRLAAPVDLRPHGSAMLPFLSGSVDVRRITLFNSRDEAGRAAVRVSNITKQTLPAGPVTVFEGGGFAGETGIERLKPGQRTFLAFAVDLDAEVSSVHDEQQQEIQHVTLDDEDRLEIQVLRTTRWKIELESRSASDRLVYVRLNLVNNAKVTGADEMDYDATNRTAYAVFKLNPGQKTVKELMMVEGIQRNEYLNHLKPKELEKFSKLTRLPAADRGLLAEAAKRMRERDKQDEQTKELEERRDRLNSDLERLRGHLKALGPMEGRSSGQVVQRVLKAEDELTAVLDKLTAAKKDKAAKLTALKTLLKPLSPTPKPPTAQPASPKPSSP